MIFLRCYPLEKVPMFLGSLHCFFVERQRASSSSICEKISRKLIFDGFDYFNEEILFVVQNFNSALIKAVLTTSFW